MGLCDRYCWNWCGLRRVLWKNASRFTDHFSDPGRALGLGVSVRRQLPWCFHLTILKLSSKVEIKVRSYRRKHFTVGKQFRLGVGEHYETRQRHVRLKCWCISDTVNKQQWHVFAVFFEFFVLKWSVRHRVRGFQFCRTSKTGDCAVTENVYCVPCHW